MEQRQIRDHKDLNFLTKIKYKTQKILCILKLLESTPSYYSFSNSKLFKDSESTGSLQFIIEIGR